MTQHLLKRYPVEPKSYSKITMRNVISQNLQKKNQQKKSKEAIYRMSVLEKPADLEASLQDCETNVRLFNEFYFYSLNLSEDITRW